MPKISILVVDDHMIVREGLKAALSAELDMEVVGEAEDGRQAIAVAKQTLPDVVIMDVAMPVMNGAAATRDHLVDAEPPAALVHVALDPVIEQVIVSGDDQIDMMLAEERHVQIANRNRRRLEVRGPPVRT